MKTSFDWKFWLVLVATLAGVAGPVWLWRFDLASRSLVMTVTSQTALSPVVAPTKLKLTIALDGKPLDDPYSSVVTISNNGAKPILPTEIEGYIAIEVGESASLVQAQVIETHPASLTPTLIVSGQSVAIQPLLLNPGDSITISILTAKGSPVLRPKARIAGVQDVVLSDSLSSRKLSRLAWIGAIFAPLAVTTALMLMISKVIRHGSFNWLATIFASTGSLVLAVMAAAPVWDAYLGFGGASRIGFAMALTLVAALIARRAWSRPDLPGNG